MAYLCMARIGAARTGEDLLNVGRLIATGELERMVDEYLCLEAQELTRQKEAKEAKKRARTVTQQDIPPPTEPESG